MTGNNEETPKRPRGRPRKAETNEGAEAAPKRPRGRPRKTEADEASAPKPNTPEVALPKNILSSSAPHGSVFSPSAGRAETAPERPARPAFERAPVMPPPAKPESVVQGFPAAPEAGGDAPRGFRNDRGNNNNNTRTWNNNNRRDRNNNNPRGRVQSFGRNNRYDRQPLSPEQEAQRQAEREAARQAAEAEAAERVKLAQALNVNELQLMDLSELRDLAAHFRMEEFGALDKAEMIFQILRANARCTGTASITGVVQVMPESHAFLRSRANNYQASADDVYISSALVRRLGLRSGDSLQGELRPPRDKERYFALAQAELINGAPAEEPRQAVPFEAYRPVYPDERLVLETPAAKTPEMRIMDIITPVGKGQRGLIAAPPRSGKTVLLQQIAASIAGNNPETKVYLLLLDERPEEVTEMERGTKAEVLAATFDEPAGNAVQLVEMMVDIAKRHAEDGKDVVILLDSITHFARACMQVDANGLQKAKRLFGAARNLEGGGSLTILATALLETGSAEDVEIFEAFQSAANMTLRLDRAAAEKGVFPALDIPASGTCKAELLMHADELTRIAALRKELAALAPADAMETLIGRIQKSGSNLEFLMTIPN